MKQSMTIKFWGVRGSIPSPGVSTVRYGGNTSCVSIELGSDKILVLDAGTGIRELGKTLRERTAEIYILLSHNHWDHIQGFPFFTPIYEKKRKIYIFPIMKGKKLLCSLIEQMDGANFSVSPKNLPSEYECVTRSPIAYMRDNGFYVSRIATNHPNGCYGYRIINEGRTVAYITDNELSPPYKKATEFDKFVRFCNHADVLIHDAQYIERDMPHKHGWGHSLVSQVCELAMVADVKHLILFHHDPERSDKELDSIQEKARSWFQKNNNSIQCTAAFEGLELEI
jgi:phosphoribosyl 1,2-cyclic phosphodiesterase